MQRKLLKTILINLSLIGAMYAQAEVISITSPASGETIDTSVVSVSFTVASYFAIGDSGCVDCDGYINVFLNDIQITSVFSGADFEIADVIDGNYFLMLDAVDPNGISFDPIIQDTVSFTVIGNPALCAPSDLVVYPGDGRNTLEWVEPALEMSGTIGCGDYLIDALPFSDINTNVGMVDDWDVTWSDGDDVAYTLNLSTETTIDITLCSGTTDFDTKLEIFTYDGTDCSLTYTDAVSTGDYDDDFTCSFNNLYSSLLNITLPAGQYYIVVDGFSGATGNFEINVTESTGRSIVENTQDDFDLELLKSGLNPEDLFADFQHLQNARNSFAREIDVLCGTFLQYNIYNEADNSLVGSVDTTFFIHENLVNDSEYCYYITAEYAEGESANSDTACATPEAFTPLPVTNLSATALDEEVALSWTNPSVSTYVYFTSFEGMDGGFSATGDFERGVPTTGPDAAASGSECFGTNLSDDYNNSTYATLTSPPYSLAGLTNPMMQITHWYNIENYYDGGNVKISDDNGSTWNILTPIVDYPEDAVYSGNSGIPDEPAYSGNTGSYWHDVQFDLNTYASSTVMFRFDFGSDASVTYEGWYIDDFAIFESLIGRENDGDLTYYNVYQDGVLVSDSIETTSSIISGLTNSQSYTFGVTASYYPDYESNAVEVSATPTWLYGDVTGLVTDPNGTPLDSAIVRSGDMVDTTGADGIYTLYNLNSGINFIKASREGFDWLEVEVTVIAQEEAITADFQLIPKVGSPVRLEATAGDETIYLTWNKPGSVSEVDLTGTWTLFYDWGCSGTPGNVEVEFSEDGGLYVYGDLIGQWVSESGEVDLGAGGCDAITFDYNSYFYFDYYTTVYYLFVEENEFTGIITSGYGDHDGDNFGQRLTVRNASNSVDQTDITQIIDLIIGEENVEDNINAVSMIKQNFINRVVNNQSMVYDNTFDIQTRSRVDSLIGYNVYQVLDSGDTLVYATSGPDDTTATISVPANYMEYCYNVKARWNTDNYGVIESKPSNTACAVSFLPGDIDFNDNVDVSDLLAVVDFVLEVVLPSETEFRNADMNNDMQLNIADVIMIIDVIVGSRQNARTIAQSEGEVIADLTSTDQELMISLDYAGLTRGIQFTLRGDKAVSIGTPLLAVDGEGTMVVSNQSEDGTLTVLVFNGTGGTVDREGDMLVRIPYKFTGSRNDKAMLELTDIQVAGILGQALPVTIREKRVEIVMVPSIFALHQNYPNPFNPVTEIQFDVPIESQVKLTVYNIMGQEVRTLTNETLQAGFHSIRWDGTNGLGESVSTGLYFYRLSSSSFTSTKKMVMVK